LTIRSLLLGAAVAAGLASAPAHAVVFDLVSTGAGTAVGTQARAGFEAAAAYWSSVLTNDITIKLNIGYSTLATGVLGSTGSTTSAILNPAFYTALGNSVTSSVDQAAVASLRPLSSAGALTVRTNALAANGVGYVDTATRVDNDESANNRGLAVNSSVLKALGITTDWRGNAIDYGRVDGSITFSDAFTFDFDPTDGIAADAFDFVGVAIHEIGHALGFRSGVDSYDAATAPGASGTGLRSLENFINIATPLDLFRYGQEGELDWSTQGVPYFSIDGGQTQLFGDSRFATGARNGDGRQASHFKDSPAGVPQTGVMDPTSGRGQMQDVTALDIAAFDAIGWTTSFDALTNSGYRETTADIYRAVGMVPEPATWGLMLVGFAMVGGATRYRRRATTLRAA